MKISKNVIYIKYNIERIRILTQVTAGNDETSKISKAKQKRLH